MAQQASAFARAMADKRRAEGGKSGNKMNMVATYGSYMVKLTQPIRSYDMKKVLSMAAIALMIAGSTAFAGEKCTGEKKEGCSTEKKAECSAEKKTECSAKKAE